MHNLKYNISWHTSNLCLNLSLDEIFFQDNMSQACVLVFCHRWFVFNGIKINPWDLSMNRQCIVLGITVVKQNRGFLKKKKKNSSDKPVW